MEPKAKRAESVAKRGPLTRRAFSEAARRRKNHTVILNGVSPWAQAGAKRSEESLKVTWAEAVWWEHAPAVPAASARFCQRFFAPFRMTAGFWCAVARGAASALLQRPQKRHAIESLPS